VTEVLKDNDVPLDEHNSIKIRHCRLSEEKEERDGHRSNFTDNCPSVFFVVPLGPAALPTSSCPASDTEMSSGGHHADV
jgi:hypothetical protein